ncbi:MAG: EamA family transporter [Anaerolineae bacterium]
MPPLMVDLGGVSVVALIGTVVAFVTFGIVLKLAAIRQLPPTPVAFTNYVLAAVVTGGMALAAPETLGGPPVWILGGLAGAAFVTGFYINYRAIDQVGLAIAQPVASVAVILPILASVVFWGERPSLPQTMAILVACLALLLLGSATGSEEPAPSSVSRGGGAWRILLALFLVQGAVMLAPKALEEWGYGAYRWGYLAALFTVASVGSGLRWASSRERLTPLGAGLGVVFGTANVAATVLLLASLAALPGIIVYPVTSVGSMVLAGLVGVTVWSERPGRRALAGMALAVPSVLLLNL